MLTPSVCEFRPSWKSADALAVKSPALFGSLSALKGSFDTAYDYYVAKVQQRFALLLNWLEQVFLSGLVIRGAAGLAGQFGIFARRLHVGNGFIRNAPRAFPLRRPRGQSRDHGAGARDDLRRSGDVRRFALLGQHAITFPVRRS